MEKVEVYKTDVDDESIAETILDEIRQVHPGSDPSIDLEDRDKVLRIESPNSKIEKSRINKILSRYGYEIEILP